VPSKAIFISAILFFLYAETAYGQCTTTISTFPYRESFESDDGGWTPGGTNNDWTWGSPAKTNITVAGTGTRCWMTGGLTGNSYKDGQKSWLRSPCFDLSSLPNPVIYFKIFWDTERNFDGAGFQYSTDNGATWHNLGTAGASTNCLVANWYNDGGIVYLGDPGWSGNTQSSSGNCVGGFGSWGWLVAQHDLSSLAGEPNVMFRFTFGSGTQCNAFNGVAIDDINIKQAAPGLANFVFSCGTNRTVSFLDSSSLCAATFSWNFGDPASGANNTSTLKDPVHVFSSPGTYTVTQTVTFPSGPPSILTKTVGILDATVTETSIRCFGENNGSATASLSGGTGGYTYNWNTIPVQATPAISNLKPGTYIVTLGGPNACTIKDTAIITEPQSLKLSVQNAPEKCDNNNGSLTANITGGTTPYTYTWSNGVTASSNNNLSEGSYALHIADTRGCTIDSANIVVINYINSVKASLGQDTTICPGEKLTLSPGNFSTYLWQDNSTAPTFEVSQTGTYHIEVTDADGCESADAINVEVICIDIFFPSGFTPDNNGKNDGFGPGGKLNLVKNYSLKVYSRYGDIVFQTNDPYRQWDGKIKGTPSASGTYIWFSQYEISGRKKSQQGTVVLMK
jgi:gliding motility-associated-like protein